ncbi:response regulator transcription factor [Sphingopyxis sp.]|uniref:response regulator transcription factor n=1 Tax=Sphingopyxis sp. TaxID=1908224 RepID=UPI002D77B9FD|nr:response regulator transcription factor [Sphingopyxis sp.]HET6526344.1 response regulator transcription factor [Sphingopyxis sp.]
MVQSFQGTKVRIILVEDNARIGALTAEGLSAMGFCCDIAPTLAEASELLAATSYDIVVLDLGMPDGDGREWLMVERSHGLATPVIMLTARSALGDRIDGLDAGADDYLIKPFAVEELGARVRALLRRPGARLSAQLSVGSIEFDTIARTGTCSGEPLHLSQREAALLELMLVKAGSVVSRDQIEASLYPFDDPVTPNAIEVLVSRVRKKLATLGVHDQLVTLRGVGYLMIEPVGG